ncbi:hypothetical protein BD626DRAFT_522130 [Schizophyllum amplum]|uniref:Uncharacterized protein n=1 Tax=Schizophyllum amplum TaxID=97359 RepID=A0A550BTF3_9AGAR|nr:hypothetical protein BD626DRAFT_522130 [Auriculariopsis ampla]
MVEEALRRRPRGWLGSWSTRDSVRVINSPSAKKYSAARSAIPDTPARGHDKPELSRSGGVRYGRHSIRRETSSARRTEMAFLA